MPSAIQISRTLITAAIALSIAACSDEQAKPGAPGASGAPSGSAAPKPPATASAAVSAAPAAPPSASASAAPTGPVHDCPAGSSGDATLAKPCEASGTARMMEVTWTGKITDEGPSFRVVNKATATILYGKLVAYFYDKAGKQLEVKDAAGKMHPNQPCLGNLFSGVMKPAEKAVINFSCVKKEHVPEGTAAIEVEMQTVGFADATEKKSEYFWRNNDLAPDQRPKGGIKKK